jgi:hypothetical protein
MEKVDEPQNAGIPGDEIADASVSLVNTDNEATQSSPISDRVPLPWIGAMPRPNYGVMAVVNEDGYLVPVYTAGDLLRACKIIWQATSDRS